MGILLGVLEQGMIYAIMALGVYITYKILDFPDLTVDGSFPLGAAVSAYAVVNGVNPYLSLVLACVAGAIAGVITGVIHVKFKVRDLLSGIITMTALYSINLRVAGQANLPFYDRETIFKNKAIATVPEFLAPYTTLFIICVVAFGAKLMLDYYMKTKSGYLLRAVGDNGAVVTSLAKDSGSVKIMGLTIANALVALSGAVMCQQQRFFEASMGTGTIVIGLATVIIGTKLFKNLTFIKATLAVIIGSVLYKGCVAVAILLGFHSNDMRLITAGLFLVILIMGSDRRRKGNKHAEVK